MSQRPYSVIEINTYIRDLMDLDEQLHDIWIIGEVSNMKQAASGHWYFTLKDAEAQLRCVMFRSAVQRQVMLPQEGDRISVHGKISVYEARGEYQLYADEVQPAGGVGDLYQQFEALKQKLDAEGLFDPEIKRPLPGFPLTIGVVTSPDAAAFQDVQNVLRRRFPLATVILSPTLVQGAEAPMGIVKALARLNEYTDADVIIICRGGGSIEDLWAFNDERVARAISVSRIPTLSGIGHETDFTIADFVVDFRAPTPSAAAEVVTPSLKEIQEGLMALRDQMHREVETILDQIRIETTMAQRSLDRLSPETATRSLRQRVDDLQIRLSNHQTASIERLREGLRGKQATLQFANPTGVLARGYAIVSHSIDGTRVVTEADAPPGTAITIRLHQGELKARTEDKQSHDRYKRTLF